MEQLGGAKMILGMDADRTIKGLISDDMYNLYIKKSQIGLSDSNKGLSNDIKDVLIIGAKILKKSIEYTPVLTGALRDSVYMKSIGSGVEIGYRKEYAIHVHEIGFYRHNSPTRYKFLEDAAFEVAAETKTDYRISISYEPLAVYINIPDKGKDLVEIKKYRDTSILKTYESDLLKDITSTNADETYINKLKQFFNYWGGKDYSYKELVEEWFNRGSSI